MSEQQESADSGKLDSRYDALALAVANGDSIRAAAELTGIPESTAYHQSRLDVFKSRVNELRTEMTTQAVGKLAGAVAGAVDTLITLQGESNEPQVRLNAAKAILANVGPITEIGDLRVRIEELEAARATGTTKGN